MSHRREEGRKGKDKRIGNGRVKKEKRKKEKTRGESRDSFKRLSDGVEHPGSI